MDDDIDFEGAAEEIGSGLGIELADKGERDEPTEASAPAAPAVQASAAPTSEAGKTPAAAPTDGGKADPAGGPTPAPKPGEAPATWRPEAKGAWETLPEIVKAEILKREEDARAGVVQYKAAATFGNSVQQAIQPFAQVMRQHNVDPVQLIPRLFNAHQQLALGTPEQKTAILQQLAREYNINLGSPTPKQPDPDASPFGPDPEVLALHEKINSLQSMQQQIINQRNAELQRQQEAVHRSLQKELNDFAADPEHAFLDELAPDMAIFIQTGRATTLKEAYQLALRLTPEALTKEEARIAAKTAALKSPATPPAASQAAAAKTAAARNATGVNLNGNAAAPSKAPAKQSQTSGEPLGNLGDGLDEAYDAIIAKASK